MRPFKLPYTRAPLDALIAYVTDVNPLFVEHRAYFAAHHAEGEGFANALAAAGTDLLAKATAASLASDEAELAAAALRDEMTRGRFLVDEVRKRGSYLISELSRRPDPGSQANARALRVACGIGSRISVSSPGGVSKLLMLQHTGVDQVQALIDAGSLPDFRPRLAAAIAGLDAALETLARRQNQARLAKVELDAAVSETIATLRRAVRLLDVMGEHAPLALRTGMRTLQGQHAAAFRPKETRRNARVDDLPD